MDDSSQRVRCVLDDRGVADVRLNRPDKINALDRAMFEALVATGRKLADDSAVRAVVLSGTGRGFCSGLDFATFGGMADGSRRSVPETSSVPVGPARALGQQAAYVWSTLAVPVIAAVHGVAFGGGLQIALGADIRVVAPDARLSVMEVKWGLIPDMTGTQLLPELVGRDVAKELTFTGRIVDGAEAARIGLATQLADDPYSAALELALVIAAKSTQAVRRAKQLLDMAGRVDLETGFAAEQKAVSELIGTPEQVAAVQDGLRQARDRKLQAGQ